MVGIRSETIHPLMQSNWVEMMSGSRSHYLSPHALCHSGRDESSYQMMTVISQNNSSGRRMQSSEISATA